jgi:hypothetical protein
MAKRRSAGKIQPAPLTHDFIIAVPPNSTAYETLDLSQVASIVNRRFYRQGLSWVVSGFKILSSAGASGDIGVYKLPSTWMVSNAWEKCFRAWQRQQREALDDGNNESVKAAFNDFKIYMDDVHHAAGIPANIIPVYNTQLGEWEASQIVIPNFGAPGVNYEPYFHMVGDDVPGVGGSLGMVKAYAASRGVPQSPDPAVPPIVLSNENYLNMMFDVGDNNEDVMDNVVDKNNDLPYDQVDYPGADVQDPYLAVHDQGKITASTVGGTTHLKGGVFPCGLVRFKFVNPDLENSMALVLLVELVPGPSRGYLTQPMTEM